MFKRAWPSKYQTEGKYQYLDAPYKPHQSNPRLLVTRAMWEPTSNQACWLKSINHVLKICFLVYYSTIIISSSSFTSLKFGNAHIALKKKEEEKNQDNSGDITRANTEEGEFSNE